MLPGGGCGPSTPAATAPARWRACAVPFPGPQLCASGRRWRHPSARPNAKTPQQDRLPGRFACTQCARRVRGQTRSRGGLMGVRLAGAAAAGDGSNAGDGDGSSDDTAAAIFVHAGGSVRWLPGSRVLGKWGRPAPPARTGGAVRRPRRGRTGWGPGAPWGAATPQCPGRARHGVTVAKRARPARLAAPSCGYARVAGERRRRAQGAASSTRGAHSRWTLRLRRLVATAPVDPKVAGTARFRYAERGARHRARRRVKVGASC